MWSPMRFRGRLPTALDVDVALQTNGHGQATRGPVSIAGSIEIIRATAAAPLAGGDEGP